MQLSIDIRDPFTRRLQAWPQRAEAALGPIVQRVGTSYLQAFKDATPRGKGEQRGTRLVDSYQTTASGLTYRITNRAPQLRYVLRGRPAVVATRARALRFVIGGVVFFRRRVKAAPANNFPPVVRRQMAGEIRQARTDAARAVRRAF